MNETEFNSILRFMVASDIHYHDEYGKEQKRMEQALKLAYDFANNGSGSKKLDAVCIVGDFANRGTEKQMLDFKTTLENGMSGDTELIITMASHEFMSEGEEAALEKFGRIFKTAPDVHKIINGFHFIAVTTTHGCNFSDEKIAFAENELKIAHNDSPKKPIFFFQHPHISGTVYGSTNWGDDALYPTLMNYPSVIDFSGHSHAPINDPRSIHQKHFTSVGTGSLSYFELDEFDKYYGTVPPDKESCAQFLIVEADADNRVRIYPIDVLTKSPFPCVRYIDEPSNPDSFTYTDARYKTGVSPVFPDDFAVSFTDISSSGFTLSFPQATISEDYVNDYLLRLSDSDGNIVKQLSLWSGYYLKDMPKTLSYAFSDLKPGTSYTLVIKAGSFWNTYTYSDEFGVKTDL